MPIQAVGRGRRPRPDRARSGAWSRGLADLDGFSHLILDLPPAPGRGRSRLTVTPVPRRPCRTGSSPRARRPDRTRSACRRCGSSAVSGSTIEIEDVDMVDGTPLLDIKPYVPAFDERQDVRVGWYTERLGGLAEARADDRFGTANPADVPGRHTRVRAAHVADEPVLPRCTFRGAGPSRPGAALPATRSHR